MNVISGLAAQVGQRGRLFCVCLLIACAGSASAQEAGQVYVKAADLLPQETAGYVRIPNFPEFWEASGETHLAKLAEEPAMKPFIEAQKERARNFLSSVDNKIGLKPEDLSEIGSGEAVAAWLPFPNDKIRPFAVCVIVDVRGREKKTETVVDQIDKDFKAGGATRKDMTYGGQNIRVYQTKPKPGQLKLDEIAITYDESRVIATDRLSVAQELLDAIAGRPKGKPLSSLEAFTKVIDQSNQMMADAIKTDKSTHGFEWYAKPFQMGRILRELFDVDRGNNVDIIKLLENQGFTKIVSVGGVAAINGQVFDILHRGLIYVPDKSFEKAARMLLFPSKPLAAIPGWVSKDVGSFNRMNWVIEDGFWFSETLVDEALGDKVFRPMVEGIKNDEEGPQIDLEADVLPALDDELILITDNTLPAAVDSERMLLAIRVKDPVKIKRAVEKAMEVEPDAKRIDALKDVDIWRVESGDADDIEIDILLEGFPEEEDEGAGEEPPPLLEHWAIAAVEPAGGATPQNPAYLMFSSHADLLVDVAKRIRDKTPGGLSTTAEAKSVAEGMKSLGAQSVSFDRFVNMKLSLRVKYELLRKNELKDSGSVMAMLLKRLIESDEGGEPDPINAKKLPPFNVIEKHLPAGGSYIETVGDGWTITGFYLK